MRWRYTCGNSCTSWACEAILYFDEIPTPQGPSRLPDLRKPGNGELVIEPHPKSQAPNKPQLLKSQTLSATSGGSRKLELVICLGFGACDLVLGAPLRRFILPPADSAATQRRR